MGGPVTAWLSLGGNQGDSRSIFARALRRIAQLPDTQPGAVSALYETPPWGDEDQSSFHNAVASCATGLDPEALLQGLQEIERDLGRVRDPERPWGPRAIDIDILLFGDITMDSATLTIPHPRLTERAFVLLPLVNTEPAIVIPGAGFARDLLARLSSAGISQIAAPGWEHAVRG